MDIVSPDLDNSKPGVGYSQISDRVRTYDLFLFRGVDFISKAIETVENRFTGVKDFTHVGMAIRPSDLPPESKYRKPGDKNALYIFESTASGKLVDGVNSVVDGKGHLGVQLRDMASVVVMYDANSYTRMAWMPLQDSKRPHVDPEQLESILDTYMSRPYDASFVDLVAAASPCMRCIRDCGAFRFLRDCTYRCCCGTRPSTWLFCSELCAQIYVNIGVFPSTLNPANVLPVDFLPVEVTPVLESEEQVKLKDKTVDADGTVPWVFRTLVRFHADCVQNSNSSKVRQSD